MTDQLSLIPKMTEPMVSKLITKREVLQESSKVFDPMGFATPVTIRSKLLMQKLWKTQIDWDVPLEADLSNEWMSITQDMNQLHNIFINRRYTPRTFDHTKVELHTFTDASTKAYGAITFFNSDGHVTSIMAKARVAPLKSTTLPRLELMAAVTGARITKFVMTSLNLKSIRTYVWTDSQIVLYWTQSSKKLPPFVAHCVEEIHQLIPMASWKYCPTNENPADLLTRGLSYDQLASSKLWWHGPDWLPHQDKWPEWEQSPNLHLCALAGTVG